MAQGEGSAFSHTWSYTYASRNRNTNSLTAAKTGNSLTLSHYLFLSSRSEWQIAMGSLANEKKSSAIPHQKQKDVFVLCLPGGTAMPSPTDAVFRSNVHNSSSTHARSECFMVFPLFAVVIFIVVCFFNWTQLKKERAFGTHKSCIAAHDGDRNALKMASAPCRAVCHFQWLCRHCCWWLWSRCA